ncbi:hypothetical protein P879_10282 [Paragonimus westermani]|uniref:Uncharacterized protein n=1 Tax=Paragonimus westermani TaxID=34504 RepID=A0A8T0D3C3_9TREM|nr:hypothetical protein P879_10282 [Paragonimus westermani]
MFDKASPSQADSGGLLSLPSIQHLAAPHRKLRK